MNVLQMQFLDISVKERETAKRGGGREEGEERQR